MGKRRDAHAPTMTWWAAPFSPCSPKTFMSQRGLFATRFRQLKLKECPQRTFGTLYRFGVLPSASIASMSSFSSFCSWKFSSMRDLVTL